MAVSEDNFPRGGQTLNKVEKQEERTKPITLFGKTERKKKTDKAKLSKKQREKNAVTEKANKELTARSADALSYKSISEGMVILGCIHKVNEMAIEISLPGRIYGYVMVTNISGPYTKQLQKLVNNSQEKPQNHKQLKTLFKPGQYVCTKVLSSDSLNEHEINLSLSPTEIYSGIKHSDVIKGSLYMVAVESIEEHGYVIDMGIPHCRAFLLEKEVPSVYGKLGIGEILWCSVIKVASTPVATTVNLTALKGKLSQPALNEDNITLRQILPGMRTEVTVDKVLANGLQVKFLESFFGYISESHLQNVNDESRNYSVGQVIQATILYIMPISKLTYMTMRDLETVVTSERIKIGDIVNAKVIARSAKGVYFKISKQARGFVTYKRIKIDGSMDTSDSNVIARKYGKGSMHNIRVLSFDFMDNTYICSNESNILKEKLFSLNDLNPGQIIDGIIQNVSPKGLLIRVGKVTGLITLLHLSDIPIKNSSLISRFVPQQKLRARVLVVNKEKGQLYLTMKPSLMDNEISILSSYEEAKRNKKFKGVIVQILSNGLLVAFFNDVKGFIPNSQFGFQNVKDPRDAFFIGQVIECLILHCDKSSKRLTLTLKLHESREPTTQIALGERVSGVVKHINVHGLRVMIGNSECFLPSMHLTENRNLNDVRLGTYNIGDTISDMICVKSDCRHPILNLCEGRDILGDSFDEESAEISTDPNPIVDISVPNFSDIKKDSIIKGWVHKVSEKNILVYCFLKNFKRFAVVPIVNMFDTPISNTSDLNIVKNQPLVLRATHVNREKCTIQGSAKLSDVWDFSTQPSVDLLVSYLHDIYLIHESWKSSGKPLGSLKIGQRVEGTVKQITENSIILELPNKVEAVAQTTSNSGTLTVNDSMLCIVLWLDFVNNCAEVCIDKKVINRISGNQGTCKQLGEVNGSTKRCEILLIRPDFVIGALRGSGSKLLAFLPTYRHTNDLFPAMDDYSTKKIVKTTVIT